MAIGAALSAASAGFSILGGVFDFLESKSAADIETSRGRMLRLEAEADATRFEEDARAFKAQQGVQFLKGGILLEGSPLAILDETALRTEEQLSAIRARGAAQEQASRTRATAIRNRGRSALISGLSAGIAKGASVFATGFGPAGGAKKPPSKTSPGFDRGARNQPLEF